MGEDTRADAGCFNLLDSEWIPVLYADGRFERVGIRKALEDAGSIRTIAASNPMDRVALLRFLLAVLYWCRGNPPEDDEKGRLVAGGQFPAGWFSKLDEHRDCFNLLGAGERFYQNSAYQSHSPEHTINYLIHEVPSGTNKWHFRHASDMEDGLCPACCVLGLLRLSVFATSGGKGMSAATGKSPGINAKPPLYVLPIGNTLAESLCLSWTLAPLLGAPVWEDAGQNLSQQGEVPLLLGLTWIPRSIWLGAPEVPEAICAGCGRRGPLIRCCVFDGKGSSKAERRIWRDPHVIYDPAASDGEAGSLQTANALGPADAAASEWARQMAAIIMALRPPQSATLWIVGFSTVQNDKYLEAVEWTMRVGNCTQQDQQLAASLERWHKESTSLARAAQQGEPASTRRNTQFRSALDAMRPHVEQQLRPKALQLLRDPVAAPRQCAEMMQVVAQSLSPGITTRAVQRRGRIAQTLPNMAPSAEPKNRKAKAKKGKSQ